MILLSNAFDNISATNPRFEKAQNTPFLFQTTNQSSEMINQQFEMDEK